MSSYTLHPGDCLEFMRSLPDDPPTADHPAKFADALLPVMASMLRGRNGLR